MKTNLREKILAGAIISTLFVLGMALFGVFDSKNVLAGSIFGGTCKTATATTSVSYMTPGLATTTLTCFLGSDGVDSANLRVQFTASSTSSVILSTVEYSQDGVDWYQNNTQTYAAGAIAVVAPNTYTWTFASSTVGGLAANTRVGKSVTISTPTRFVRVVLSSTGANSAVWAEITPKNSF